MPDVKDDEVTDVNDYFKHHDKYLLCRMLGHAFRPTHKGYLVEGPASRPITLYKRLKCIGGCGLTATDYCHPKTLERIGNRSIHYTDEPSYLAKGTKISRQDARLWERATYGVSGDEMQTRGRRKRAG